MRFGTQARVNTDQRRIMLACSNWRKLLQSKANIVNDPVLRFEGLF
jgi:aspartyl/asparaginyl beta-hydroxylase (cupin superfamily)